MGFFGCLEDFWWCLKVHIHTNHHLLIIVAQHFQLNSNYTKLSYFLSQFYSPLSFSSCSTCSISAAGGPIGRRCECAQPGWPIMTIFQGVNWGWRKKWGRCCPLLYLRKASLWKIHNARFALGITKLRINFNRYLFAGIRFTWIALISGLPLTQPALSAAFRSLLLRSLKPNHQIIARRKPVTDLTLQKIVMKVLPSIAPSLVKTLLNSTNKCPAVQHKKESS